MRPTHLLTILAVRDLERAVAFYTNAFAYPVTIRVPVFVEFALPRGMRLGLYERAAFATNPGREATLPDAHDVTATELYLVPPDLDACIEAVRRAGGEELFKYPARDWGSWTPEEYDRIVETYGPPGLKALASPDGLNWRLLQDEPVITPEWGNFDSQNVAFWSEAEKKYVTYFRWFDKGYRSIRRMTSDDFLTWSNPIEMKGREPKEHLYTNGTQPYFRAPHIYIALPTRFQASAGAITDIAFMATRPGSDHYHRHFREAFIRPGLGKEGWGNRANYITLNVVQSSPTEMKMFMYGGAQYVMRLDGFVSVRAGYEDGEFLTNPFRFSGDKLVLNASTAGAGNIRVEILDENEKPIPGFTAENCDAIRGDSIAATVTWEENADLSDLAGKMVRLRFVMNEADIYSLQFPATGTNSAE